MNISKKRLLSPLKPQNNEAVINTSHKKVKLQTCDILNTKGNDYDEFFNESDDSVDWLAIDNVDTHKLDLSACKRCTVQDVINDQQTHSIILTVSARKLYTIQEGINDEEELFAKCYLKDSWRLLNISKGDVISLQGVWDEDLQAFRIDQKQGMCVIKPDNLISGTTVMGSLFCRRKAVLQERFRGIDANSKVMVIGSLVHELLQVVLEKKLHTINEIKATANSLLYSENTAFLLYSSQLTTEETCSEILQFVPHIYKFVNQYVKTTYSSCEPIKKDGFQGYIADIEDIEENLWVPQLGLKGKVDVSVRVHKNHHSEKLAKNNSKQQEILLPLELKTGRASFSMEHKGQLILYQMMLTAANRPTQSGLLLYLRDGIMREIVGTHNEHRDLINLRNDLCHYLSSEPTQIVSELPKGKFLQPFQLPEPISHAKACQQCPYQILCCTFANTDQNFHMQSTYGINNLVESLTEHLTIDDIEYFLKWCNILMMEEKETKKASNLASLWTRRRSERQKQGTALCGLILSSQIIPINDNQQLMHEFIYKETKENEKNKIDFTLSGFSVGEYVIISTYKRLAVATGVICNITSKCVRVNLERNLLKKHADETFVIDKHESSSCHVFNFTNLGILIDKTERSQKLRNIIIKNEMPEHINVLPKSIADHIKTILSNLNTEQRHAVLKALTTQTYLLIKGLPGTGKTQTLVAIIRLLYLMNKTILITSHTHSAVDNLLIRLKNYDVPFLRLGSTNRVHPLLHEATESHLFKNYKSVDELVQLYNTFSIIGVTCLGCSHPIFLYKNFDICIVDEATQVMQPTVLRPLFYCERFILVGDPHQLPPLIRNPKAHQHGADISLFEKLSFNENSTVVLSLQYRMNKTITKLANALTYEGQLKCATNELKQTSMKICFKKNFPMAKWLTRTLQCHIDQAVVLLDTLNCSDICMKYEYLQRQQEGEENQETKINLDIDIAAKELKPSKYTNYCEAAIILSVIRVLLQNGYNGDCIGIIAPYRAQVELLKKLLQQLHKYDNEQNMQSNDQSSDISKFSAIEINTVDQYQGRDKDIIIYSCTRTDYNCNDSKDMDRSRDAEILEDQRRLTVAVTRAKLKLIIIGDACCIQRYTPFKKLLNIIPGYCKLKLEQGKMDFQWETILNQLLQIENSI